MQRLLFLLRQCSRSANAMAVASLFAITLPAQKTTGGIEGTVTDPTGALVPSARVTATDETTGEKLVAVTDQSGTYRFREVHPHSYLRYPVDSNRVGILGWSYGGSTSIMAVTRTHRFRAAVAGAGASNMQSYYGQNSIDKWMIPYFGASVYDDPAAYMRVSAISYIKNAKTPALILVGELDGKTPPVQSMELWHGLKELGVPAQLVIYADEGHSFFNPADRTDLTLRSLEWFEKYMGPQ